MDELAFARSCVAGDAEAIARLDREFLSPLKNVFRSMHFDASASDELLQQVRERLLIAPARLETFRGTAPLSAWLRAVATRMALNARRDPFEAGRTGDAVLELVSVAGPAAEVRMLRLEHASTFAEVFREAFRSLSARERNALRLQCLDALTLEQIATIYSVNKATVSRWISSARESLEKRVRNSLVERVGLSGAELDSFIVALRSQLELASLLRTQSSVGALPHPDPSPRGRGE